MRDYHGIIFAYSASPELRTLVAHRTAASLPFCGRYRLIDLSLSSLRNAGILDVGVIMQRDYQSLLDHIGSGKPWDMSRKNGGLRMLPPFGLPEYHRGEYAGTMEALNAVASYIEDIPQKHIVLLQGNICANIDIADVIRFHESYSSAIRTVDDYYKANMDMLCGKKRREIFPPERPVRAKPHDEVSSYYGEEASAKSSLVADNCKIEGKLENCIVFSGARIAKGAKLKNCILMRGATIGEGVELSHVIVDKHCTINPGVKLTGSEKLPVVVPKYSNI